MGVVQSMMLGTLANQMQQTFGDSALTDPVIGLITRHADNQLNRSQTGGTGATRWSGTPDELQNKVFNMAKQRYGWGKGQWDDLDALVSQESGWNPKADNPTSSAYGLFQFLDSTRDNYGISTGSPLKKQVRAGLDYIKDRYGNPEGAWDFHQGNNWY